MKRMDLLKKWGSIPAACPITGHKEASMEENQREYLVKNVGAVEVGGCGTAAERFPITYTIGSYSPGMGSPQESRCELAADGDSAAFSKTPSRSKSASRSQSPQPAGEAGEVPTNPNPNTTEQKPLNDNEENEGGDADGAWTPADPQARAAVVENTQYFFRHGEWEVPSIAEHARQFFNTDVYKQLLAAELQVVKTAEPTAAPTTKKEKAFALMRSAVSQNKVRFQEDGFDLDLTYITERIIAMGFPSHGKESYFRNPVDEVERFFTKRHGTHFRIYNLCSERHYDRESRFGGRFKRFPFDDHNAPCPIKHIPDFCRDATNFMKEHEDNVVAIHCKAGKGRTGLMISCLLMYTNPSLRSPGDALGYFGEIRTSDGKGVTIPSQMRYVRYWDTLMSNHNGLEPPPRALRLRRVTTTTGVRPPGDNCDLYFFIEENGQEVFDSRNAFKNAPRGNNGGFHFDMERMSCPNLCGDIKFYFYHRNTLLSDDHLFHFWLNTSLCSLKEDFVKRDLDKACKDKKNESVDQNLGVHLEFDEVPHDPRIVMYQEKMKAIQAAMAIQEEDSNGKEENTAGVAGDATNVDGSERKTGANGSDQPSVEGKKKPKKSGGFLGKLFGGK